MTSLQTRDRPGRQAEQLPIDPRIAARWVSVRRERNRRHWRAVVAVMVALSAVAGAWVLARSPLLSVNHVTVEGNGHTDRRAVLATAGLLGHRPLVDVKPSVVRRRLQALPWIATVGVQRRWPDSVAVEITERRPAATVLGAAGQVAIVDATGRILALGSQAASVVGRTQPALPSLLGVPRAGAAGSWLGSGAQGALAVLQALHAAPPPSFVVASVSRSSDGTLAAALSYGKGPSLTEVSVIFGSSDQLLAKVTALRSVLGQVLPGTTTTIDVQVADLPVLTKGQKSTIFSTIQRG